MDETQTSLNQDNVAGEAMESMGIDPSTDSMDESGADSLAKENDPLSVKKRLGMQAKRHQRQLREMQEQLDNLQARVGQGQTPNSSEMSSYGQSHNSAGMTVEEQIQRGVRYALEAKEEQERKAREAEQMAHVHRQYQRLQGEFDRASEKYEDFDDVVRGDDAPFTAAVRDALLMVDNPADVAYKLGKNRDELKRISALHPLEQAREVNKLSFALMNGLGKSSSPVNGSKPMGNIRANPVNSQAITDKTPASAIRARMKAGTWK